MAARPGEAHHFAVLTEKQVLKLRQQPDNMGHYQKLCQKVWPGTVQAARSGRTWQYLNREARPVRVRA